MKEALLILQIEIASSTVGNDYNGKEDFEMDVEYIEHENYFVQIQMEVCLLHYGGERIKKKVIELLKQFFLNGNINPEDRLNAQGMHAELMEFVRAGEIEEENVPKVGTIQNWIGRYSCKFNHEETFMALQNFNTENSSN
ncbi:32000_t:CDS:2 [Gigaspora margarita]|uniref:32000_t:CDS:1 n=1 Tax=Gigaspora margarita TaxID=4874 RepID=A0ABN7VGM0_GIGMA|nr:32000_t:CDS:2 [Gigaspora margarita]